MLKPIVEVKPGDYVLSLNEQTQQVEPHKINGLLDMGVKPVYKLTTASGRSIRTTANHPYLVKVEGGRWLKASELKAGDGIGVPKEILLGRKRIEGGKQTAFCRIEQSRPNVSTDKNRINCLHTETSRQNDRITTGKMVVKNQIISFKESSLSDIQNNNAFLLDVKIKSAQGPAEVFRSNFSSLQMFVQGRGNFRDRKGTNCDFRCLFSKYLIQCLSAFFVSVPFDQGTGIQEINHPNLFLFSDLSNGICQTAFDFRKSSSNFCKRRDFFRNPFFRDIFSTWGYCQSLMSKFLNCKFVGCLHNVMPPLLKDTLILTLCQAQSAITIPEAEAAEEEGFFFFDPRPSASDILWDKIVSIEYVGNEQVYDIEVQGTHNFIGNGIFAHNTYLGDSSQKSVASGQGKTAGVESISSPAQQWQEKVFKHYYRYLDNSIQALVLKDMMYHKDGRIAGIDEFFVDENPNFDIPSRSVRFIKVAGRESYSYLVIYEDKEPVALAIESSLLRDSDSSVSTKF